MSEGQEKKKTLKQLRAALTPKQRIFSDTYTTNGFRGADAVRAAGYSENSVYEIASENLRKPHIKQYIQALIEGDNDESTLRDKLVSRMKNIAFSNIRDVIKKLSTSEGVTWAEWESLPEAVTACIQKVKVKEVEGFDAKGDPTVTRFIDMSFHDAAKMQTKLFELLGYAAPDKLEHSGKIDGAVQIIQLPDNARD